MFFQLLPVAASSLDHSSPDGTSSQSSVDSDMNLTSGGADKADGIQREWWEEAADEGSDEGSDSETEVREHITALQADLSALGGSVSHSGSSSGASSSSQLTISSFSSSSTSAAGSSIAASSSSSSSSLFRSFPHHQLYSQLISHLDTIEELLFAVFEAGPAQLLSPKRLLSVLQTGLRDVQRLRPRVTISSDCKMRSWSCSEKSLSSTVLQCSLSMLP